MRHLYSVFAKQQGIFGPTRGFCPFGCPQAFQFRAVGEAMGTLRRHVRWLENFLLEKGDQNGATMVTFFLSFLPFFLTKQSQLNARDPNLSLVCQESKEAPKYKLTSAFYGTMHETTFV